MRRMLPWCRSLVNLLRLGLIGAVLVTVRYMLKMPQPLDSALQGETHLYTWRHGHIWYTLSGAATNPPLVLLHAPEIGGSSYEMRALASALSEYYQVYTPDLLGFGLSDHPRLSYSAATYIELYKDFLRDVVGRPATLLASGLSCNHVVALASQEPTLCERLVLLSPRVLFQPVTRAPWWVRLLQQPFVALVLYAFLTTPIVLRRIVARRHGLHYNQISKKDLGFIFAAAHQLAAHYSPIAALAGNLDIDVSTSYEQLTQQVLIIWGLRALDSQLQIAQQHSVSSQTQLVLIEDAGPHVQEDQPATVVEHILAWQQQELPLTSAEEKTEVVMPAIVEEEPEQHEGVAEVVMPAIVEEEPEQYEGVAEVVMPAIVEEEPEQHEGVAVAEISDDASTSLPESGETAAGAVSEAAAQIEAYCVKCRQKRFMQNPVAIVTKNGRRAMEGVCPICGTKLFRFIAG